MMSGPFPPWIAVTAAENSPVSSTTVTLLPLDFAHSWATLSIASLSGGWRCVHTRSSTAGAPDALALALELGDAAGWPHAAAARTAMAMNASAFSFMRLPLSDFAVIRGTVRRASAPRHGQRYVGLPDASLPSLRW